MYKLFIVVFSFLFLVFPNIKAEEVSVETKLMLQNLMNEFIEDLSVDGKIIYIDTKSDKLNSLYFSTAHPMYVPHEGSFFLCTSGFDENGEEHMVDFYAKEIEGNFKIVDVSVDSRETTKKILGM